MVADIPRAMMTGEQILHLPQDPNGSKWWLLQTSTRLTHRLSDALAAAGATPVNLVKVVISKRINGNGRTYSHRGEKRMLPNYVFVNGTHEQICDPHDRYRLLYNFQVIRDQQKSALELSRVVDFSNAGIDMSVEEFAPGRKVRVTSGFLMGYIGFVIEHRPREIRFSLAETGKEIVLDLRGASVEAAD